MDTPRAGVFVLFVLVVPVSCEGFFTGPVVCYFLDAFLMLYCIVATALFFREKFSVRFTIDQPDDIGGIYQELERPGDDDAYQVLETSRGRVRPHPLIDLVIRFTLSTLILIMLVFISRKRVERKRGLGQTKPRGGKWTPMSL
ncbi:uncharacterized protein LOC125017304 isoform X1 [Mugil cephalus]|uniref:uncharacterized protein LOC125017304 isoform X1 n=1 Tax=Mugil cephalus TaxID=48193 RepID=UPI001FB84732|nr:uncharacterized protein LOC125017304 isoform X1 [Mugil cephalus]